MSDAEAKPIDRPNPALPMTRAELLALIDWELNEPQAQANRLGFTAWALLGSVAYLVWSVVGQIYERKWDGLTVSVVYLFCTALLDLARSLISVGVDAPVSNKIRFVRASTAAIGARGSMIVLAIYQAVSCVLWWKVRNVVGFWWALPGMATGGALALMVAFVLLVDALEARIRSAPVSDKHRLKIALAVYAVQGVSLFAAGRWCFDSRHLLAIADVRSGMLLATIMLLMILLASGHSPREHLLVLRILRRSVAFGEVTIAQGLEKLEAAVMGHSLETLFGDPYKRLKVIMSEVHDFISEFDDWLSSTDLKTNEAISTEDVARIRSGLKERHDRRADIHKRLQAAAVECATALDGLRKDSPVFITSAARTFLDELKSETKFQRVHIHRFASLRGLGDGHVRGVALGEHGPEGVEAS